jgi:membrane protease YdiL (CAAX protease family)
LIAISLVFLILATVGIAQSKKLGRKYIGRGVRLLVPFIAVFVVVMVLANILPMMAPVGSTGEFEFSSTVNAMASAPFGGEKTVLLQDVAGGQVYLKWGFGLGLYLLLFAGIIVIVAGVLELVARSTLFEQRQFEKQKKNKKPKTPVPAEEMKKE